MLVVVVYSCYVFKVSVAQRGVWEGADLSGGPGPGCVAGQETALAASHIGVMNHIDVHVLLDVVLLVVVVLDAVILVVVVLFVVVLVGAEYADRSVVEVLVPVLAVLAVLVVAVAAAAVAVAVSLAVAVTAEGVVVVIE